MADRGSLSIDVTVSVPRWRIAVAEAILWIAGCVCRWVLRGVKVKVGKGGRAVRLP